MSEDLSSLKGIGKSTLAKLNKANIHTLWDLLLHLPKDYQDRRTITPIGQTVSGQKQQISGVIRQVNINNFGKKHLNCYFSDDTGMCKMHLFKFYPNQTKLLQKGKIIRCFGEINHTHHGIEVIHPEWQIINDQNETLSGEITAIYPTIEGISSTVIHKLIKQIKSSISFKELLPTAILQVHGFMDINSALMDIHFPQNSDFEQSIKRVTHARYRLAIEEMLAHNLNAKKVRLTNQSAPFAKIKIKPKLLDKFISQLPFAPTKAQERVIAEIFADLTKTKPCSRLVQGDVGSGKTIVASACLIQSAANHLQSVMMTPTEILAEQHYHNLSNWLSPFDIPVVFIAQKLTAKERKNALKIIQTQHNCVIVGTHAVFQQSIDYPNLGLVIIDEQHRFGVEQRLALIDKSRSNNWQPHQIVMTATPIPRTLAMTVYGDLDLSIIDELPPNRKPITTSVLNQNKKQTLINKLEAHINADGQAYWVCPLIESSEVLVTLQDAESLFETIKEMLPSARIGLIHGKMKAKEKALIMQQFKAHELDILVATTVIEVGVDVPNANIMIIDNAERLGLSQLHQLRGRVGRGHKESNCILLYQSPLSLTAKKRLELMRQTQDGFIIAEEDLKLRGPGDIFGKNQTGDIQFKVADLSQHQNLFDEVATIADTLIQNYPQTIEQIIGRWLTKADEYIKA
ncbi:ATP-dependent DNA helicase RecG [Cysteiniphilum sp. QT6929]|uniref:ATP-dependent DNA helicase RecG n=1 Tax=Cysteiniphilum sp. QT6929 TaxID=2975055 RepID=UPI0024B32BEE|nr:ATP-dependent DNA helicase RecG [Cysteiniphilum sp. QT6929]WHN66197.1 ATP-dependent DNA helicase RecG [Cysteiniphilum sp. QT6929]